MPETVVAATKTFSAALDLREESMLGFLPQLECPPLEFATGSLLESVRESTGMEIECLGME